MSPMVRNSKIESLQLWNKKRSAGAGGGVNCGSQTVMVGIDLGDYTDKALPTGNVNPPIGLVIIKVISVPCRLQMCNDLT